MNKMYNEDSQLDNAWNVNLALNEDSFVATNRQDWWCIRSHSVSSRKARPKHQPGTRNRRNLRRSIHRRPLLPSCCVGPNPRLLPKTRRWRNRSDTSRLTSPNHNRGKGQTEITGKSCGYCFTFIAQSKLFLLGLQVFPFKKNERNLRDGTDLDSGRQPN